MNHSFPSPILCSFVMAILLLATLFFLYKRKGKHDPLSKVSPKTSRIEINEVDKCKEEVIWLEKCQKEHVSKLEAWAKQTSSAKNMRDMHRLKKFIGKEVIVETIDFYDRMCRNFFSYDTTEGVLKDVSLCETIKIGMKHPRMSFSRTSISNRDPIGPIRKITHANGNVLFFNPLVSWAVYDTLLDHQDFYLYAISFGCSSYFRYHRKNPKLVKINNLGVKLGMLDMEIGEHLNDFAKTAHGVMAAEQALEIIKTIRAQDMPTTKDLELSKENSFFWEECQKIACKLSQNILIKAIFREEAKGNRLNMAFLERLASILFVVQYIHPKGAAMYRGFKFYRNMFD